MTLIVKPLLGPTNIRWTQPWMHPSCSALKTAPVGWGYPKKVSSSLSCTCSPSWQPPCPLPLMYARPRSSLQDTPKDILPLHSLSGTPLSPREFLRSSGSQESPSGTDRANALIPGSHQGMRGDHKPVVDVNLLMAEGRKLTLRTCELN